MKKMHQKGNDDKRVAERLVNKFNRSYILSLKANERE